MKRIHKKKIQNSIIVFILITIATFFLTATLNEKTNASFALEIQMLLDEYEENKYTVLDPVVLLQTPSTNGSYFSVMTNQNIQMYASIIRIMGIGGPVSAVFLYDSSTTNYIGLAGLKDIISDTRHGISDSQISYWENKMNLAFSEYTAQGETE